MFTKVYKSFEIRNALDAYTKNKSFRKAAKCTGISKTTIHRWYHSFHFLLMNRNKIQKRKKKRRLKTKFPNLQVFLKSLFEDKTLRYYTLTIIQKLYKEENKPSVSWIAKTLKTLRISRRRFNITKVVSNNQERYMMQILQFNNRLQNLTNEQIVCIDETGFCNVGNVIYRYYPKGKVPDEQNVVRREKRSVIMGIHPVYGIICPYSQKEAFNSTSFFLYLKDSLIPSLPNGVKAILMDNVAFHKTKLISNLLDQNGLEALFIPPYTPRCNPIEEVFSVAKNIYRSSEDVCTTSFSKRIESCIEQLKLYKGIPHNYNHTRRYVADECLRFELSRERQPDFSSQTI